MPRRAGRPNSQEDPFKKQYLSAWAAGLLSVLAAASSMAQSTETPASPPSAPASSPAATPDSGETPSPTGGSTPTDTFVDDDDRLDGDTLKLRVNVDQFKVFGGTATKKFCAPKGTKVKVTRDVNGELFVRFELTKAVKKLQEQPPSPAVTQLSGQTGSGASQPESQSASKSQSKIEPPFLAENTSPAAYQGCSAPLVNDYTQYVIDAATLRKYAYRRSGVMFGALIVPFKFHIGGKDKLSPSSTIAPYIGVRLFDVRGMTVSPVFSAGLGLVPVTDLSSGESATKSAFSTAAGLLLTHSKNDKFNAGFLIGQDFLSKSDRGADTTVDNPWFSLYAGYKL